MESSLHSFIPAVTDILSPRKLRYAGSPSETSFLHLSASIRCDARRLFYALTVPEYVETWLTLPGSHAGCSTLASRIDDQFVLEHSCRQRLAVSISGIYSVCRRRSLSFSWRVDGDLCIPETEVDIRLRGDFESTTLMLRHSGFGCRADWAWHGALWSASLERLIALYGSSDGRPEMTSAAHDERSRSQVA